ncbi:putative (+)-abscisic acid 8'-hydroxylase [Helianthus annuus]|nr:putative (+)-abscisic acid 8'-hydroxylase [Helianthus annuus]
MLPSPTSVVSPHSIFHHPPPPLVTLVVFLVLLILVHKLKRRNHHTTPPLKPRLPPGSMGWPYIGETLKLYTQNPNSFFSNREKRFGFMTLSTLLY